jgi:lysophospholipase L1-like esterase
VHRLRFLQTAFALCLVIVLAGCSQVAAPSRPLRVACLGDSITEGAGTSDRALESYPAQLAKLLGPGYEVHNFGVSGSTLLDNGDKPYRQQIKFGAALKFQPDIVVIALGTNDTKPQNWHQREHFVADYIRLIRQLRDLQSRPRIFICQPMPAWPPSGWGISPELIEQEIRPLVAQIAATEKTGLIDLFTPMRDHHDLTPDHVHPDARGAAILAQTVADALRAGR